jgi:hypothetical protein
MPKECPRCGNCHVGLLVYAKRQIVLPPDSAFMRAVFLFELVMESDQLTADHIHIAIPCKRKS